MLVEIHMVQNFAPSCLNRDDTNAPKDCGFGGYRRARISSQCLKRSIRTNPEFANTLKSELGVRTKRLFDILLGRLTKVGKPEDEARTILQSFIPAALGGLDKQGRTGVLFFLSQDEIENMQKLLLDNWNKLKGEIGKPATKPKKAPKDEKPEDPLTKACEEVAKGYSGRLSPDIALFGRMMAEKTSLTVEGACQVAHAISTHKVDMEMDFYTAVDDLQEEEETGAGMMGTVEFNSACFYRYSVVNMNTLVQNLGSDKTLATKTLEGFIRASVAALPSGRQSSMAAHNPPSLVLVVVRSKGQPVSLSNAFVRPVAVAGSDKDLVGESISRLDSYFGDMTGVFGKEGIDYAGLCTLGEYETPCTEGAGAKRFSNLEHLLKSVSGAVNGSLGHAT